MSDFPVLNFQDFISFADGKLTTDSLKVAAVHGKQHAKVLALIRKRMVEAGVWGVANFGETLYTGSNGEAYPMFTMTKDGYAFLVGRMTGKLAVQHQIAYIEAFGAMAAYIDNQACGIRYRIDRNELAEADSFRRGSIHGRGLRVRQLEAPVLKTELEALKAKLQPYLPMFDAPSDIQ
jgi:Rha family phage regulatory protein